MKNGSSDHIPLASVSTRCHSPSLSHESAIPPAQRQAVVQDHIPPTRHLQPGNNANYNLHNSCHPN